LVWILVEVMRHGGDLSALADQTGRQASDWLDLSTGINPVPYPIPQIAPEAWTRLPQAQSLQRLRAAARKAYAIPETVDVVAAPGSEILIETLARTIRPGRIAIAGKTYGSHARAWSAAGHTVSITDTRFSAPSLDVALLVNPDNPTGHLVRPAQLVAMAQLRRRTGGLLIVDEAFADVVPDHSLVPDLTGLYACVRRSFGKFYGLAGLRLGFLIGPTQLITEVANRLGEWAVSGPALDIGTTALEDSAWAETTRARLRADALRLDALLIEAGLSVQGGTDLFRLAEHADATSIHERLIEHGILVRRFVDRPTLLRFGLPGTDAGWQRLTRALTPRAG
jgi:cobalamin biosynthetic protein CobC